MRGLDGLRAIAVAAVVIFHATEGWLRGGFLGVDVFFVLSGYLITAQLLAEWRGSDRLDLVGFWKRRARRILAALYFLLAVTLVFALVAHPSEVAVFRGDAVAALGYVANWYFVFRHQPYFEAVAHPSPLLHLWSLGVEEQFYLLWPLLLAPALRYLRGRAWLPILAAAAASTALMALLYRPEIDPSRVYYGTDTHASGLLIGALLAFFWSPGPKLPVAEGQPGTARARLRAYLRGAALADATALAALAALAGFFLRLDESQSFLYRGGFTLVALTTALAVVAASHPWAALSSAALEWRPVRWLGRRSYSVYLWHWPVIVFTRPAVDVPLTGLLLLALRLGLSLALAELSYRYVEEPVRRGALVQLWHRLRQARESRQRRWAAAPWLGATGLAALVVGLGFAVAAAKAPPPPAYLAVSNVDTIVWPSASSASPTATVTSPATATVAAGPGSGSAPANSANPGGTPAAADSPTAVPPATPVSAGRVIAIGDSVMLGAVPQLTQTIDGVQVNAAVSRQVVTGIQLLQQLHDSSALGQVVIVGLGSNGEFTSGEFDRIMSILAGVPRVVFVNIKVPRPWEAANNAVIQQGVQRYQNARLVDWHGASAGHTEYFQADEYHLRPEGAVAYAALLASVVAGP